MTILVTGGSGYLGTVLLEDLAKSSSSERIISISSKPLAISPELLHRVDHHELELETSEDLRQVLKNELPRDGVITKALLLAGRGTRGLTLEVNSEQFQKDVSDNPRLLFESLKGILDFAAPETSVVCFSSLWGRHVPDPSVYLDLGNEPSPALVSGWGGQRQLMRYLALLLAPKGIRINSIEPGWFPKPRLPLRDDYIAGIVQRIPMGRIGRPQDLIGPTLFLLSEQSSYMTGETLVVDGGYSLR